MAQKQELEIKIDDQGNVSIHVIGGEGKECLEQTKAIEEALGIVTERVKTGEYYVEPVKSDAKVDQKGGGQGS